jgi:hypothetical protein
MLAAALPAEGAGQVHFDHADQAIIRLVEREDSSLAYLKQGRPVERVEDVLPIKNCS